MELTRYRFIIKDGHSYIVDILETINFKLLEIFEV